MESILKNKGTIIWLIMVILISIILIFWNWSVDNKVINLTERFSAQLNVSKTAHDEMWKVINQDAEVADKYAQDFEKIFTEMIDGRYSNDGDMLMKWIQERNPNYTPELYKELMSTIKTERSKFKRAQDICIDIKRELLAYIKKVPNKWFVNNEVNEGFKYKNKTNDEIALLYKSGIFEDEMTYTMVKIINYEPVLSIKTNESFEKGIDDDVELYPNKEVKPTTKDSVK